MRNFACAYAGSYRLVSSVFCGRLHEVKFFQVDLDYKSAEAEAAAAGGKKSTPEGDQMYCKENRH